MPDFSVFVAGNSPTKPVNSVGRGQHVWNTETVAVGHSSVPVALNRTDGLPSMVSVELLFSGAPGAFAVDLQAADTAEDKYFVSIGTITVVNSAQVGRLSLSNVVAGYVRLHLTSLTNTGVTIKGVIN